MHVFFLLCALCELFSVPFVFGSSVPAQTSTILLGATTCWKLVLEGSCQPEVCEDFFHGNAFASPILEPGFRVSFRLALFFGYGFVPYAPGAA